MESRLNTLVKMPGLSGLCIVIYFLSQHTIPIFCYCNLSEHENTMLKSGVSERTFLFQTL